MLSAAAAAAIAFIFVAFYAATAFYARLMALAQIPGNIRDTPVNRVSLPRVSAQGSYHVKAYGFEITFAGYGNAESTGEEADAGLGLEYSIPDGKSISIMNSLNRITGRPIVSLGSQNFSKRQIENMERASGRKIESTMDLDIAALLSGPSDLALLDYRKNSGLKELIRRKYAEANRYESIDVIEADGMKCVVRFIDGSDSFASFASAKSPEDIFNIIFHGFRKDEVEAMVATIRFEGENTPPVACGRCPLSIKLIGWHGWVALDCSGDGAASVML